jgi:hypothetical protein
MNSIPIAAKLLQLRCASCNKVQQPSSPAAIEFFHCAHWFHSGYTLLVEIAEPAELTSKVVDVQAAEFDKSGTSYAGQSL